MINGLILDNRDYAEAGLVSQNGGDVGLPFRPIRSLRPFPSAPVVKVTTKQNTTQTATKDTSGSNGIPEVLLSISAAQSPVAQQAQTASLVTVTFTRDTSDSSFDHVRIWVKGYHGNTNPVLVASGSASPISFVLDSTGESVLVYGQTASASGQTADLSFAKAIIVTLSGTITAPPAPTITQTLVATPLGYQFAFAQIALPAADEEVMSAYRVYRNSSNSFSGSSLIRTLKHDPTNTGSIVVQDNVGGGQTFFYWVTSVNTAGLESTSTAAQSGTVTSGTASLDNDVSDGTTYNRIKATEVVTGFVKQVNDGTNIRNAADIGTVVKVGGRIQLAAIIDGRSEGIGTTVQKLNSSGLLLDADQVAADGANYLRSPQYSGSSIALENPNFVAGTAGWSANGTTIAQSTTSPFTNGKSLQITTTTQFAGPQAVRQYKASAGDKFFISGYALSDGTFQVKIQVTYFDGSGAFLGSDGPISTPLSWTQIFATGGAAPANTAFVTLSVIRVDAAGGSHSCWVTDLHLVRVASLDNEVADGSTYNRFKAANMFDGGATSAHICNQIGALVTQQTILSFDSDLSAGTWTNVATATIQLAPGTNSITLKVSCGSQGIGSATAGYNGIGFAVYSGAAPATPQVSQSFTAGAGLSTTSLTLNNPTTGIVNLSLYVSDNGVVNKNPPASATPAALFQNLVTAFANGVLT